MHVLVEEAEAEDLIIVLNGLASEELLWLLERAVQLLDFIRVLREYEAVGDPAVVTAEDYNFRVVQAKTAQRVPRGPQSVFIDELYLFPFLLLNSFETIESLNSVEGVLSQAVSAGNHIDVPPFQHGHGVVVS